jgi:hypothetical protein
MRLWGLVQHSKHGLFVKNGAYRGTLDTSTIDGVDIEYYSVAEVSSTVHGQLHTGMGLGKRN